MFSSEICENFKNTYFEEHLPTVASINEKQQETHALFGKKNESHVVNLHESNECSPKFTVTWIRLNYLTSVALLFNFIPLDYESMVAIFITDFHRRKSL